MTFIHQPGSSRALTAHGLLSSSRSLIVDPPIVQPSTKRSPFLCHPPAPACRGSAADLQFRGLFLEMFFDRAQRKDLRFLFVALQDAEKRTVSGEMKWKAYLRA